MGERSVLHVDLDAFYAAVEQRDDPSLRGQPVVVGGTSPRGVVCAASYEARRFGIRSAMPMGRARVLCPTARVVAPRMRHYAEVSAEFFAILRRASPLVEGLSLDEAFLDVTGQERLFGDGPAIGAAIRHQVREELSLTASVGVAPCKFAAKIASDLRKPDALVVVPRDGVREFLAPLPIGRLWGVGEVMEQRLRGGGFERIGQLAVAGESAIARLVGGEMAAHLAALARGEDDREVVPDRAAVSVGAEETYEVDLRDRATLTPLLLGQVDRACQRLRRLGQRAAVLTVKVKYADFTLCTRRTTLARPTADASVVGRLAIELLALVPAIERRGVRLTGISLSGLGDPAAPRQLALDEAAAERGERLGEVVDRIVDKFGGGVIRRAVHLDGSPAPRKRG